MKETIDMEYHPTSELLVDAICKKSQTDDPSFFRVLVAYYFSVVSTMMRCQISTEDRGDLPTNLYAVNLAPSGFGKGLSTNIIEKQVINQFRENFLKSTFPLRAAENIPKLSYERSTIHATDPDEELLKTEKEFKDTGPLHMSFDSGSTPALKQARHKMLMAKAGSLNLKVDEIGSNLLTTGEILDAFLELYDVGDIGQKLTKNTADNTRNPEIEGYTPANMMLFGTPFTLQDGGKVEEEFDAKLLTGFARRCFFACIRKHVRTTGLTPKEIFDLRTDKTSNKFLEDLSDKLGDLADLVHVNKRIIVPEAITCLFIEYQLRCESLADALGEHEDTRKAELSHRHNKALKLAGTYAFIDGSPEVTEDQAYYAIKLTEASGEAFTTLLARDRPYVKLAKYIAEVSRPVTLADLVEDLPFYKGTASAKQEMMQLAIAHGYQNNIIIKKVFNDGIEFLHGETLQTTNLDEMTISYSTDLAQGYREEKAKFSDLHMLTQAQGMHWCNHGFKDEHRNEDNAIPGFNLIVLDVDGGIDMSTAQMLLKDYKALFYTTKRHTEAENRFRILMPINFELTLDAKDYKELMRNIYDWLPFDVDDGTGQRSKKWLSNDGAYAYQDGVPLDVLPFIPKTSKNEEFKAKILDQQGMDNLERWVMNNAGDGNRNKILHRYAMILVDGGFNAEDIRDRLFNLNKNMSDPLSHDEIRDTIMVSVSTTIGKKLVA